MSRLIRLATLVSVFSALGVGHTLAQAIPTPQPTQVPGQAGNQISSGQVRDIMALRALQMRGRSNGGGVRTGYPQFVPGSGMFGPTGAMPTQDFQADPQQQPTKSSTQRRAEARKLREEEKRAAKEKADAKKAAQKGKGKAKPAAVKKPAGKAKDADPQA